LKAICYRELHSLATFSGDEMIGTKVWSEEPVLGTSKSRGRDDRKTQVTSLRQVTSLLLPGNSAIVKVADQDDQRQIDPVSNARMREQDKRPAAGIVETPPHHSTLPDRQWGMWAQGAEYLSGLSDSDILSDATQTSERGLVKEDPNRRRRQALTLEKEAKIPMPID
jgi:hypothetical protein